MQSTNREAEILRELGYEPMDKKIDIDRFSPDVDNFLNPKEIIKGDEVPEGIYRVEFVEQIGSHLIYRFLDGPHKGQLVQLY